MILCYRCLQALISREGKNVYTSGCFDSDGTCEWCGEKYDELYDVDFHMRTEEERK